jgi:hypothetical protein
MKVQEDVIADSKSAPTQLHWQPQRRRTCQISGRDAEYVFACHAAWKMDGNIKAYIELVAALDDINYEIRVLAEVLIKRKSPWPMCA